MEIFRELEQGTPEWSRIRAGRITGTKLKDIMVGKDKVNGELSATTIKAMNNLSYKLLGGEMSFDENAPGLGGYLIEQGNELEPIARAKYAEKIGKEILEIGFITNGEYLGLSSDGCIFEGEKIVETIEIKCPLGNDSANFFKYKIEDKIPDDYLWQVVHNFVVIDDLQKLTFIAYNPNIAPELQFYTKEVTREELKEEIMNAKVRIKMFRNIWEEHIKLILLEGKG